MIVKLWDNAGHEVNTRNFPRGAVMGIGVDGYGISVAQTVTIEIPEIDFLWSGVSSWSGHVYTTVDLPDKDTNLTVRVTWYGTFGNDTLDIPVSVGNSLPAPVPSTNTKKGTIETASDALKSVFDALGQLGTLIPVLVVGGVVFYLYTQSKK